MHDTVVTMPKSKDVNEIAAGIIDRIMHGTTTGRLVKKPKKRKAAKRPRKKSKSSPRKAN